MYKMPRIWLMYLQTLIDQKLITRTRRTFDPALCSSRNTTPSDLLVFVSHKGVPSSRVYRRYLKFDPTHIEKLIEFLVNLKQWQEGAEQLARVLNDDRFCSIKGKTKHQLWLQLCDLVTNHAIEVSGFKVEAIIRFGIRSFTNEVGCLWTSLADYYIRRGLSEKVRGIFEEGMTNVVTVRDFSVIFDAYSRFEETTIAAKLETVDSIDEEDNNCSDGRLDCNPSVSKFAKKILRGCWLNNDNDLDLRLAQSECLMDRRPEPVNSVLLRQNHHNVEQWHQRVKLFKGNPTKQILMYTEAVRAVDPMKAVGKPHSLWVAFAKLYENHKDVANARVRFDKAVQVDSKTVDNLASILCEWAEMELRRKNFKGALELMRRATAEPLVEVKQKEPVHMKLHKSLRLWTLYVDLEEILRTLESTRAVYEQILNLKIANPQIIINSASLLEEHNYVKDDLTVYERGVKIFKYPHVSYIWSTYLSKYLKRYGETKLDGARELFQDVIAEVPAEYVKPLYLQFAKLEEDCSQPKHAMKVYDQAVKLSQTMRR